MSRQSFSQGNPLTPFRTIMHHPSIAQLTMKALFVISILLLSASAHAQQAIADWNISVVPADKSEEQYLVFSAQIDDTWDVYASNFEAPIGPLPTVVELRPDASYEAIGKLESEKPQQAIDPGWSIAYTYFSGHAEFRQRVKVKPGQTHIRGVIKGQYLNKRNKHLRDFEEPFDLIIP